MMFPPLDEDRSFHPSEFNLSDDDDDDDDDEDLSDEEEEEDPSSLNRVREKARMFDRQARAADRLSMRLLQTKDEERVLRESFNLTTKQLPSSPGKVPVSAIAPKSRLCAMISMAVVAIAVLSVFCFLGFKYVGPPNQPVGPYQLIERQEGMDFFNYYNFYEGRDSAGSNGFLTYVSQARAVELNIVNVSLEADTEDVYDALGTTTNTSATMEPFVYMGSSPTPDGPRDSIRLEGKRRFNRGLFIIDLRHMPEGCGVWPAFWLTDEANWPVNGEIDIVEGVNYQSMAKTALHSTQGCNMDDVPLAVKTGEWDTAIGIPNKKTGIPDMTMRYATNCFVYDPKQWLNQGCVAVDAEGGTLGKAVNTKGGGVYVLEWDPVNRHIRTWVFTPHINVPENLRETIKTAKNPIESERILPDPDTWPLPYGYFAIGEGTDCPSMKFKNMRLVFNLAFCGSVAGNRFQLDCPKIAKEFKTCNDWVKSDPDELKEAYWKIRGVYVYEREWQRAYE